VIGTDKGLCGILNSHLFKSIPKGDIAFISIGRKAMQFLSRTRRHLLASFSVNDRVQYHEIQSICDLISKCYVEGEIDEVEVLYQKFINTLSYVPTIQKILPMNGFYEEFETMLATAKLKREAFERDGRELMFEPGVSQIVDHIAKIFLKYNLHQVLLEAKASEHSARMVAMKNATDSAETLSQSLKLEYNKARQYAITNEIVELSTAALESN
jgi:F-type H+-transporting ATPase subunit gamma